MKVLSFVGFLMLMTTGASSSFAASITVDYTGQVTSVNGSPGVSVNQDISGSLTLLIKDPPSDLSALGIAKYRFNGVTLADDSSPLDLSSYTVGFLDSETNGSSYDKFQINASDGVHSGGSSLTFQSTTPTGNMITSLASLSAFPTDLDGLATFLGAAGFFARGSNSVCSTNIDCSGYVFDIRTATVVVNQAPIPATLPLFVSALAALGGAALRRRNAANDRSAYPCGRSASPDRGAVGGI